MINSLKSILLLCVFVFSLLLVGCGQPDAHDAYNRPIYLKELQGKWVLLNYWADWCKPCYKEIPVFNQLYKNHHDKVEILAINFDQMPQDKLLHYIKKNHIKYSVITDNIGAVFGVRHVNTLPATFVISPKGEIVKELYGEQTEADLLALMDIDE